MLCLTEKAGTEILTFFYGVLSEDTMQIVYRGYLFLRIFKND